MVVRSHRTMNTSEHSDAQVLWKMFYARECFRQVRAAAQYLVDGKLERDHPLFHPLITATYVLYAKPFTRADAVGKLGEEMIPADQLEPHRTILEHRHQVYAHRDGDGFAVADYGAVSQVRALRLPQTLQLFGTDFHARYPALPPIISLCQVLEQKTDYHVEKLWTKYAPAVPMRVGEFMLNVADPSGDMWLPQKPLILKSET